MLNYLFWILLGVILYSYIGYTLILLFLSLFRKRRINEVLPDSQLPEVSLIIAAYNEASIIEDKIKNSQQLNYPKDKLQCIWVTDGSTDNSVELLKKHKDILVMHQDERKGKMAAINRVMDRVETPIAVFCDANTMLHPDSIKWMATSLNDPKVGCVAGEKSIVSLKKDSAAGSGEGIYWSYESVIKKLEASVGSTVGAAGELYALKTKLFEAPKANTVVDDFVVSLKIALKGFRIDYQPKAIASENASISIAEEKKRKIRIAAGSFQVLFGMPSLLNIFKHGMLSFQYISHKVLRWLIVPMAFPLILFLNLLIAYKQPTEIYNILLILQAIFYFFVLLGAILQKSKIKLKFFFIPYYIIMMNYTIVLGFIRYLKGNQKAAWEKAQRNS